MSIRVGLESVTDVRAMLEGLFEHAPTAFGVVSAAGKTVAVNQAFLDLFGSHPPPEYSIFEDEITKVLGIDSAIRRAFQGETVHLAPFWYDARELKHVKVAGRRVAIEMTLFALRKADGSVEHVALAYKDVTAERELFERERELAATLHSIGDGVIAADKDGRITRMNPVAERLTGWQQEEARGVRLPEVFNIINETTRAPVENPAVRVLREGVIVGLANHTLLVRRDGAEFPIADSGAPIRNAEGETQGVVLVFRDDTERKEAQAQLLVSDRIASIGTLAAGVAHEINNPLAAVMTNIELAAGEIAEPIAQGSVKPVVEAELKDALEAAERVRLIVRDLKLFGRGDEENHGFRGEITFDTKPGVGTRFQVALPAMPERPVAPPPPAAPAQTPALRGRVLIVDDDDAVSGALSRLLSRDNEVTVASSGAAALELLANAAPFDVVLCDLMMPQMTGMDFYEALRARAPEQAARIVFVTGGAFTPRATEFLATVQNRRVEKPISSKALRALVQELVAARHLTQ